MTIPPATIPREGTIGLHDATLAVCEEGIPPPNAPGGFKARDAWEAQFKAEVFDLVAATLTSIGWTVGPWTDAKVYPAIADGRRTCSHTSGLQAELGVNGRSVELEMWQDVTPSENKNGGKYDFDKLERMPYVLRLEVERTRRHVIKALCEAHSGYSVRPPKISSPNPDPLAWFNDSWDGEYERKRGEHRFKRGADGWPNDEELKPWARKDRDGVELRHGDVRYLRNYKGYLMCGRIYGGINGRWTLVYGPGKRDYTCAQANEFFTCSAGSVPSKVYPARERRKRLEREMQKAIAAMDFDRAKVLKGILFPDGPLYAIFSKQHGVYFDIMFAGYREKLEDAGTYTRSELKPYLGDRLEDKYLKAIEVTP